MVVRALSGIGRRHAATSASALGSTGYWADRVTPVRAREKERASQRSPAFGSIRRLQTAMRYMGLNA